MRVLESDRGGALGQVRVRETLVSLPGMILASWCCDGGFMYNRLNGVFVVDCLQLVELEKSSALPMLECDKLIDRTQQDNNREGCWYMLHHKGLICLIAPNPVPLSSSFTPSVSGVSVQQCADIRDSDTSVMFLRLAETLLRC